MKIILKKQNIRYYHVILQKDLLGDWSVIRMWGGIHNKLGGYKVNGFLTKKEAIAYIEQTKLRKSRNGYITAYK